MLSSDQIDKNSTLWSTLGGESQEGEDGLKTFKRVVMEILNVELKTKNIYPIYDYFHDTMEKINYVFYAEVKNLPKTTKTKKDLTWVNFADTAKFNFSLHTKQDLIVGERVINLKWRESQANL